MSTTNDVAIYNSEDKLQERKSKNTKKKMKAAKIKSF